MRRVHDKNYFHFTKKERTGILFLTGLAALAVSLSIVYPLLFKSRVEPASAYADDIAKLEEKHSDTLSRFPRFKKQYKYNTGTGKYNYTAGKLFYFDPNTATADDWKKLGLRDKTIGIIQNYLKKGGRFREATDLKKIWGLHEDLANRLIPYARISQQEKPKTSYTPFVRNSYPTKSYQVLNINETDTSALTDLPGIGPKLSQRIIKYRNKLGGFYAVEQVAETFGLPDSTFQKIRAWLRVDKGTIKKLNINKATIEELKNHPYIRYHLANALIQYREQHGSYASVSEIRNIMLMNDSIYKKATPYLVVE